MKTVLLFGNKETFAIQIETGAKPNKNKLCYWVSGNKVGGAKSGEITTIKKSYERFEAQKDEFYLPELEPFHIEQLREFFFEGLLKLANAGSLDEFNRRRRLCLNWGIQVDGYNVILLSGPDGVLFFYTPPNHGSKLEMIPHDIFQSVFNEFLKFCKENMLL